MPFQLESLQTPSGACSCLFIGASKAGGTHPQNVNVKDHKTSLVHQAITSSSVLSPLAADSHPPMEVRSGLCLQPGPRFQD